MAVAVVRQLEPAVPARGERIQHHEFKGKRGYGGYLQYERWHFFALMKVTSGAAQQRLVEFVLFETLGNPKRPEWAAAISYKQIAEICDVTDTAARLIVADACRRGILAMRPAERPTHLHLKPLTDHWEFVLGWKAWRKAQDALLKWAQGFEGSWTSPLSITSLLELLKELAPKLPGGAEISEYDAGLIVADACARGALDFKMAGRGEFTLRWIPPQKEADAKETEGEGEEKENPTEFGNPVPITAAPLVLLPGKPHPVPLPAACRRRYDSIHFDMQPDAPGLAIRATAEGASLRVQISAQPVAKNGKIPTVVGNSNGHVIDSKGLKAALNPALRKQFSKGLDDNLAGRVLAILNHSPAIPAAAVVDEFAPVVEHRFKRKVESPALLVTLAEEFRDDWNEREKEREQRSKTWCPRSHDDLDQAVEALYFLQDRPDDPAAPDCKRRLQTLKLEKPGVYQRAVQQLDELTQLDKA